MNSLERWEQFYRYRAERKLARDVSGIPTPDLISEYILHVAIADDLTDIEVLEIAWFALEMVGRIYPERQGFKQVIRKAIASRLSGLPAGIVEELTRSRVDSLNGDGWLNTLEPYARSFSPEGFLLFESIRRG